MCKNTKGNNFNRQKSHYFHNYRFIVGWFEFLHAMCIFQNNKQSFTSLEGRITQTYVIMSYDKTLFDDVLYRKYIRCILQWLVKHLETNFCYCSESILCPRLYNSILVTQSIIWVYTPSQNILSSLIGMISNKYLMPCPSMGSKWFWTVQIILVEYQLFWTGPICFCWVSIILESSKL